MKSMLAFAMLAAAVFPSFAAITPEAFRAPPRKFAPHVWWHWMNGNISKEGITGDLEAMADVGVAAATFFDASCGIAPGPVKFDTPEFYDAVRHAAKEAKRLGLELGMANCSGWANSGGKWISPRDSMKLVTVSETEVSGPSHFSGRLPRTSKDHGFYGDIAVMAVRDRSSRVDAKVSVSSNAAVAVSGGMATAAGFTWKLDFKWTWGAEGKALVEVSDDGQTFRRFEEFPFTISFFNTAIWGERRHTFRRPATFKAMRFTITEMQWPVSLSSFRLETEQRIEDVEGKIYHYKKPISETVIDEQNGTYLGKGDIVDLTGKMAADGRIVWNVPPGKWKLLRIGYCSNGRLVSKSGTDAGRGLEVDKLDAKAVERHFEAYVGKTKRLLGADADVLKMMLNDSFEANAQNWTHGFEKVFESFAGYSMRGFLPALTGRIVESVEATERFLSDYRKALSRAFVENYARTLHRKAREHGMEFYLEPYGNGPFEEREYARYCDVPMCEFWASARTDVFNLKTGPVLGNAESVVAEADRWGHPIVAAEAFTAGSGGRWMVTPYSIKCQCDRAYSLGVNRIVFHRFTHQPWKELRYPGMTMGPWGMHFDRTQTWWKEAKEFIRYQTRCQYMLQQGWKVDGDACHRRNVDADWHFVVSTNHSAVTLERSFEYDGRVPELWFPETGETVRATDWKIKDGRAVIKIRLPTAGSVFVVFRSMSPTVPQERILKDKTCVRVEGPWNVRFECLAGGEPAPMEFNELSDWSRSSDRALRHFSGSAYYSKTVPALKLKCGERLLLDLGSVRDFATVTVNGMEFAPMWKPPFRVDITDALNGGPEVDIAVKVTNRWPNRLIGDDALPEDKRGTWTSWRHWKSSEKPLRSGLLGPVSLVTAE